MIYVLTGGKIGNSIYEKDKLNVAVSLLKQAKEKNVNIFLPIDYVCSIKVQLFNIYYLMLDRFKCGQQ